MNEQILTDGLNQATGWLANNQALLLDYAVNIVAAVLTLIIGLFVAKMAAKAVSRLLAMRGVDVTVSDFLSAMVRYAVIAFTLIAVLGRLGVQTASVIAVLGAAGLAVGLALQGSLSTSRLACCWWFSVLSVPENMWLSVRQKGRFRMCRFFPPHCAAQMTKSL